MDNKEKKKFDSKEYYIKNRDRILEYNRKYFKEYYQRRKLGLLKQQPPFKLIIERNVRVSFD